MPAAGGLTCDGKRCRAAPPRAGAMGRLQGRFRRCPTSGPGPGGLRRALRRWAARRYRRGFSLFGVLLGLGLAAVVIVGAVGTYNAAREAANRTAALTLLSQLRANVEAAFAGAPSYGKKANLVLAIDRRGGIPGGARVVVGGKAAIRHPFSGAVTVTGGPGGVTNRFRITFEDVDDAICAALCDAFAGRSRARAGSSRWWSTTRRWPRR